MSRKLTAFLLAILMLPLSSMNVIADEGDPDLSINEITFRIYVFALELEFNAKQDRPRVYTWFCVK